MRACFLAIFFLTNAAWAAKGIECKSRGTGMEGIFRLEEPAKGAFELWADGIRHKCGLRVSSFEATPGGLLSQIILRFERLECKPAISPSVSHKLFDDVRLRVVSRGVTARARTQWLRFEQPGTCEVKKVNWKQLLAWAEKFKTARRGE